MALAELEYPFAEIRGSIGKDGIVNRKKKYRDDKGRIIHEGKQEAYKIKHPRNFKKNPPSEAEQANINWWTEACRRVAQINFAVKLNQLPAEEQERELSREQYHRQFNHIPDYYTLEEAIALFAEYKRRYNAQLPGTRGTAPDPQAPADPQTGLPKRYAQFPNFLRAILYQQLKTTPSSITGG